MPNCHDFDSDPTRICAPPTRALAAAIWPELFHGQPAPELVTELTAEEVAELVGDDMRVTAEYPAIQEETP